jgi:hypothetical protein
MQAAVDAAALLAARDAAGVSDAGLVPWAQQAFAANFHKAGAQMGPVEVVKTDTSIRVAAAGSMKTAIMRVFHIDTIKLAATGESARGQNKIELAF